MVKHAGPALAVVAMAPETVTKDTPRDPVGKKYSASGIPAELYPKRTNGWTKSSAAKDEHASRPGDCHKKRPL